MPGRVYGVLVKRDRDLDQKCRSTRAKERPAPLWRLLRPRTFVYREGAAGTSAGRCADLHTKWTNQPEASDRPIPPEEGVRDFRRKRLTEDGSRQAALSLSADASVGSRFCTPCQLRRNANVTQRDLTDLLKNPGTPFECRTVAYGVITVAGSMALKIPKKHVPQLR